MASTQGRSGPVSIRAAGTPRVVMITGASSGIGRLAAESLARAGHVVAAGMRSMSGRNSGNAAALQQLADAEALALTPVEMDVQDRTSVDTAVDSVLARHGHIDVVVHNAGHMVLGPAEAFTPDQLAAQYDVNVLGTQRVNRTVLPHQRAQRSGLVLWVGPSSTRGGHPPFLAPYFAAKAGMDALAESYAAELIKFGIDTTILVPGAFTTGTNHFRNAGAPSDTGVAAAYDNEYGTLREGLTQRLASLEPADANVRSVADEIVRVVGLPAGERPFRTHVDPSRDGSEFVSVVADRLRVEFYRRIGIEELLPSLSSL